MDRCSNDDKSLAFMAICELISVYAPYLSDDFGYTYLKKALLFNKENTQARMLLCSIYPKSSKVMSEPECRNSDG